MIHDYVRVINFLLIIIIPPIYLSAHFPTLFRPRPVSFVAVQRSEALH